MGDERRSWIDLAVKVAPYFGLSPIKVRWKLEHIRYEHKTCSACGAVQDRDASSCKRCGEPLGRRGFQVMARLGVLSPEWLSMSTLLGLSFVLAFARVLIASPGGMSGLMN